MRYPTIHLNGTSGQELSKEYQRAVFALNVAIMALTQVTVHGRDYYVQNTATGPDASCEAMNEHRARLEKLQSVHDELLGIAINIQKQIEGRKVA